MNKEKRKTETKHSAKAYDYSLMNKVEYNVMYYIEDEYWWYRALRHMILRLVKSESGRNSRADIKILDCGCGTGGMLATLKPVFSGTTGFDLSAEAVNFCHKRGFRDIKKMSITDIKFPKNNFDIAYSLDVMCNLNLKDFNKALSDIRTILKKNGVFIFNLPAFDSIQSEHDKAVGIFRRFRRNGLRKELEAAAFVVEKINYRISLLFPIIWLIRMLKKSGKQGKEEAHSDLKPLPKPVNAVLTALFKVENVLLCYMPAPFGLSVFGVARKK